MKKTSKMPLIFVIGVITFFSVLVGNLRVFSLSTGDIQSICDAKPENSQINELSWDKGLFKFLYLTNEGLFSQISNSAASQQLVKGKVDTYQLVKNNTRIVFSQDNVLWIADENGQNAVKILDIPQEKTLLIHGLSPDQNVLLVESQDKEIKSQKVEIDDDLRVIDLDSLKFEVRKAPFYKVMDEYNIIRDPYPVKSTSENGQSHIQLEAGSFKVNGNELFYCGTVRGSLEASGPACFKHHWLSDNDHVVVDLCGAVIVETSTAKVTRLNNGRDLEWYQLK